MASIRNRGEYQWQAQVEKLNRATGKVHFESKTFLTKSEAADWARALEADLARGIYNDTRNASKTPLRELIDKYIEEVSPLKKGSAQEIVRLKKWKTNEIADRMLTLINPADFAAHISLRRKDGKAEQTIKLEITAISNVFNVARKDWGYNISNPLADISKPGGSLKRDKRLLPEDQPKVIAELEKCRNTYYPIMTELAIETGLRLGEFFKLTFEDVFLEKSPYLIVRAGKDSTGESDGKERIVPLTDRAVQLFKNLPSSTENAAKIFQTGHATSADGLSRAFTRACIDAGFPGLRFHDLRHEAASRLAPFFEMHELMKILGHDTPAMVMRYYKPTAAALHVKLRKMQAEKSV